jgi:hypothetical protein
MYMQTGLGGPLPKDKVNFISVSRQLSLPYREDFDEFRKEVRKALGRYLTFRSDAGAHLDSLLASEPNFWKNIKKWHEALPKAESNPATLNVTFIYTPGFKKVTRITFP